MPIMTVDGESFWRQLFNDTTSSVIELSTEEFSNMVKELRLKSWSLQVNQETRDLEGQIYSKLVRIVEKAPN